MKHEVPLWQYLVRGLLNSLFSTHCYHIKLQNLHSPFQEDNPNGERFDQLTSELKKYEKLEQRFPSPGLPGEQKILTSELSSSYGVANGIVPVLQLVSASYTIFRTKVIKL
jgi:hypothetical protein